MRPLFNPSKEYWPGPPSAAKYWALRPAAGGPRFRGSWAHAALPAHRNAFSPSDAYGHNGWELASPTAGAAPGTATTLVDADGYTAIRANLPPIGFNKARVSIEIQGIPDALDLIDLEVPAVVVIDPGHGGTQTQFGSENGRLGGSSWNNAYSYGTPITEVSIEKRTRTLEKDLCLQYSLELRKALHRMFFSSGHYHTVVMTRFTDINVSLINRASESYLKGADIFLSIHFNGLEINPLRSGYVASNKDVRGHEALIEPAGPNANVNILQDRSVAQRVLTALGREFGQSRRSSPLLESRNSSIYFDIHTRLNNMANAPSSHACLAEIEFITNPDVEEALVSGAHRDATRRRICEYLGDAIRNDLLTRTTAE